LVGDLLVVVPGGLLGPVWGEYGVGILDFNMLLLVQTEMMVPKDLPVIRSSIFNGEVILRL
jgi:hypothetical protein